MLKNLDHESLVRLLLKILIVLAVIVTVVLAYNYLGPIVVSLVAFVLLVTLPFAIAWIIAIITRPMTDLLICRVRLPATLSAALVLSAFLTALGGALFVIFSYVVSQLSQVGVAWERLQTQLMNGTRSHLGGLFDPAQLWPLAQEMWDNFIERAVPSVLNWLQNSPTAVLFVVLLLLATFFFCRDPDLPRRALLKLIPKGRVLKAQRLYNHLEQIVGGWARAQMILISVSTALCLAFYLLMGVEGAWPLALLTGFLDILPVVGPGTLIVPWAVYCLVCGNQWLGIGLLLFYLILVAVRNILEPKLVGDRIGLHPLAVLAAVFVGWLALGAIGLFLGPLLLAMGLAIYRLRRT